MQQHSIFPGDNFCHHIGLDRNQRDQFRDHPCFERTAEFIARFGNPAFNPDTPALPLAHFEPMLRRLMASPKRADYKTALKLAGARAETGA